MVPVRRYLDEVLARGLAKNDSDTARKLGVTRAAVSDWRNERHTPNEDQAAALAELLGKPEVMAECMAARAKRPETRAMWERAAQALSNRPGITAAVIAVLCAGNLFFAPSPAEAAPALKSQGHSLYYVNF